MNDLKYLWYVIRHKAFVAYAGYKLRVPLHRLILHDYSKFCRAEWSPYVDFFYGDGKRTREGRAMFAAAFKHHVKHNDHHWNYWVQADGTPEMMPNECIREMVADWAGAGRAINGSWEFTEWYEGAKDSQVMTPSTRRLAESYMRYLQEAL